MDGNIDRARVEFEVFNNKWGQNSENVTISVTVVHFECLEKKEVRGWHKRSDREELV